MILHDHIIGDSTLYLGDMLEVIPALADIDAVVTDPPYGLYFMGKDWDRGVPGERYWRIILGVCKPGAHLLACGGTRTYHRLVCAIEDAGWEIRDTIMWTYGSGFPKSLDISKAIDKAAGAERRIVGKYSYPDNANRKADSGPRHEGQVGEFGYSGSLDITAPATEEAKQWDGLGTALKPAMELICLARKPLSEKTVAANVLKYGTGALNIDGCRIEINPSIDDMLREVRRKPRQSKTWEDGSGFKNENNPRTGVPDKGRFPANLIHDGSPEVVRLFPQTSSGKQTEGGHTGSAARFFYCAKADKKDRDEGLPQPTTNKHPTVKPTDLMRYLCRLITSPNGVVLDPFMGSGSTGKGAILEGFRFIGIEKEPADFDIACKRISFVNQQQKELFDDIQTSQP